MIIHYFYYFYSFYFYPKILTVLIYRNRILVWREDQPVWLV